MQQQMHRWCALEQNRSLPRRGLLTPAEMPACVFVTSETTGEGNSRTTSRCVNLEFFSVACFLFVLPSVSLVDILSLFNFMRTEKDGVK